MNMYIIKFSLKYLSLIILVLISNLNCNDITTNIDNSDLCSPVFCSNSTIQSNDVITFCNKENASIENRCCFDQLNKTKLVGLDYSNCNIVKLSNVTDLIRGQNNSENNIESVVVFDLRNNSITECTDDDYENFLNLQELYLPDSCSCPGYNFSWTNITSESCIGRKDICKSNYTNVECTTNSQCLDNGPGNFLCLCKENYHGYKCLEKGEFPTLTFTLSLSLGTLFFCGLLYHTQRRHVLKKSDINRIKQKEEEEGGEHNEDHERLIQDEE